MSTSSIRRATRLGSLLGAAALVAMTAAACSSGQSSTSDAGGTSSTAAAGSTAAGSTAAGVAHAQSALAGIGGDVTSFSPVGPAISGLAAHRGETVTYIPIFLEAGYFSVSAANLKQAAALVGINLRVCDGKAVPSTVAACFTQAISDHSTAIITDSVPIAEAPNSYAAAASAKIPVVMLNNDTPISGSLAPYVRSLSVNQVAYAADGADAIIAASGGKANVLAVLSADNGETKMAAAAFQKEMATSCPGCTVTALTYLSAELQDVPTEVSTALLKHPDTNYVFAQFDSPLAPAVIQGIQQAQKTSSIKLIAEGGDLGGLQRVDAGQQFADISNDPAYSAWSALDYALRLIANPNAPEPAYQIPARVFYASTVKALTLTDSAWIVGSWYTNGSFRKMYESLWGVS
jgi:ribose transport system substrate-binding protein